jgi:PrgI family protein
MPARAPLDVDLEDKLLYGLTPMRLGYVVLAFLCGFALWSSRWATTPIRLAVCLVVFAAGAALAWGRWRGRAVDSWLTDIAAFLPRTQRVVWNEHMVECLRRLPLPVASARAPAAGLGGGEELTVAASAPTEDVERSAEATDHITGIGFPDAVVSPG